MRLSTGFCIFFGFFCVFFRGWRLAFFYIGPSRASGTRMPGFTQYLYKFWHAAFTRPFDRLGDRHSAESRGRMPPQGGCFGIFARLNASLDRSRIKFGMTGFIRDDGLCWGWGFYRFRVGARNDCRPVTPRLFPGIYLLLGPSTELSDRIWGLQCFFLFWG